MYNPRKQGRKDALANKPRHKHNSPWNQAQYDKGYEEGSNERAELEASKPHTSVSADDIIAWLERNHTLHYSVETLYVVDGFDVVVTYDGNETSPTFHGETLREAYEQAVYGWKTND